MKKFIKEFKEFISRGNVMDMAVGMIVGAAFTAIVTALSNGILKPIINGLIYLVCGGKDNVNAMEKMYTVIVPAYTDDGATLDLANSVYIDWGAFISAIINFFLVAVVLFAIVKLFNRARQASASVQKALHTESPFTKEELRAFKKEGKTRDEIAFLEEKRRAEIAEELRRAEEEARKNAPKTQEQLLQEIADLLREKQ